MGYLRAVRTAPLALFAAASILMSLAGDCAAQGLPGGATPGREKQELQQPRRPPAGARISIPESSGAVIPAGAERIKLKLSTVVITGMTVFDPKAFEYVYKDKLGKEITLADVYRMADAITVKYREAGYILSRALVPAQRLQSAGARIEIRVVEGYIDRITIDQEKKSEFTPFADRLQETVRRQLQPILDSKPLKVSVLERQLLLANDYGGVTVRALIRPSPDKPGASDMVAIMSHALVSGEIGANNYGSQFTGPNRFVGRARVQSFLGLGEELSMNVILAAPMRELKYVSGELVVPIGYSGLRLETTVLRTASPRLGFTLEDADISSLTHEADVTLRYPVIRSRSQNLSFGVGAVYRNVLVKAAGAPFQEDRIRTVVTDMRYDLSDPFGGVNYFTVAYSQGIDFNNSSDRAGLSRPEARPNAYRVYGEVLRLQPVIPGMNVVLGAKWQFTPVKLLASEEFTVGGRDYGRAYDFGELSGDKGVAARVEAQISPDILRTLGGDDFALPADMDYLSGLQFYGFYDFGWIANNDVADKGTARESRSLASTGVGLRYNFNSHLAAEFEVAEPLTLPQESSRGKKRTRFSTGIKIMF